MGHSLSWEAKIDEKVMFVTSFQVFITACQCKVRPWTCSFPRIRGVKLATHLHLVPTLRIRGAIAPLPIRLHVVVRS